MTNELMNCVTLYSPLNATLSFAYASDYMSFQSNNEVITGFFETNETTHRHTATDLLVNMDPVYNYNVAKAAIGATLHFAQADPAAMANDKFDEFGVGFFPNPTQEVLNINLGSLPVSEYTFSIIDINGKEVFNTSFKDAKLIETVSVSTLSKGIYLGILQAADNRITKKIVIE
jgi:hypothetical protein